jgi:hypothetical protein
VTGQAGKPPTFIPPTPSVNDDAVAVGFRLTALARGEMMKTVKRLADGGAREREIN